MFARSMMIVLAVVAFAAPSVLGQPALPDHLRLVCSFEQGPHGCQGAANPFAAGGNIKLVDGGAGGGKALRFGGQDDHAAGKDRFAGEKSALIYDGVNFAAESGTISAHFRFSGQRHWGDGKRTWLLVLVPESGDGLTANKSEGTALAVFKEADNTVALAVYEFYNARLTTNLTSVKSGLEMAEPDSIPLRIPAGDIKAGDWARVRMGWEAATKTVWLGLGDKLVSAKVPFRKARWLCLLVGTPTKISYTVQRGYDGDVDSLVADSRSPGQAPDACALPAALPPMAAPEARVEPAVHLKGSPLGEKMESLVRTHFNMVLETQRPNGGWAFTVAWPSYMCFLSTKVVIPFTRHYFNGSKDGNSAGAACRLIAAWHILGDKKYLDGAERCAQTLLRTQRPEGFWPYAVRLNPDTGELEAIYSDERAPIEDHVQSHPVCLFYALHAITGKPEYKTAADKGVEFIYMAQNYTGSWSHHYHMKNKCGEAAQSQYKRAGEINDDSTSDQMTVMLMAWRRTGEIRFLASYLRAADWLKSAFIDDKGKGWAQQYDEYNVPIPARHFEPPAISLSEGINSAPQQLIRAWRLTGDAGYLEPVRKWHRWMMDNRVFTNKEKTKWGWYVYYDPATGQSFRYEKRKRLPADPRQVTEGGYTALLRQIENLDKPRKPYVPSKENAEALLKASEGVGELANEPVTNRLRALPLVESFNWTAGSWVFNEDAPHGPSVSPQTIRGLLVAYSVFLRRQLRGQIPFDHPLAALERAEWGSPFYMAMPPHELLKPIPAEDVAKAREWIAANPAKPTGPKSAPSPKPEE